MQRSLTMNTAGKVTKPKQRSRTAMSCDACKGRKTKCSNPVPGPCDYCRNTGAACHIDLGKRKQRPYYFVSEEEYRPMVKLLKHYLPGQTLDLKTLRSLSAHLEDGQPSASAASASASTTAATQADATQHSTPTNPDDESLVSTKFPHQLDLEELADLHEQLGCLLRDSGGEYRYTAASSGIGYNAAVRDIDEGFGLIRVDQDVIPPLKTTNLPPKSPEDTTIRISNDVHLPPHEVCFRRISQFFREVHCLYWLYPSEEFHTRLDACFATPPDSGSASWLCALYAIMAMTSGDDMNSDYEEMDEESLNYLTRAKSLIPAVLDEADLDSVRALILLALALQTQCFSNSAYLYAGCAARVAFTLGMHVDKYSITHGLVQKEQARRIWWTLYTFDSETSTRSGKPSSIPECITRSGPPFPSEQILSPGPNTPNGYLKVLVSLSQLTKHVSEVLYADRQRGKGRLTWSEVAAVLSSLREWQTNLPPWLKYGESIPPTYERAVGTLFARYSSTFILATRPFLLASIVYRDKLKDTPKRKLYDDICAMCISAAEKALRSWEAMHRANLLTAAIVADFNSIFEATQVFATAYQRSGGGLYKTYLRRCITLLQSMPRFGWCRKAIPEVMAQLEKLGVFEEKTPSEGYGIHSPLQADAAGRIPETSPAMNEIDWTNSEFGDPFSFDMEVDENFSTSELLQQASSLMTLTSIFDGQDYSEGPDRYSIPPGFYGPHTG